MIESLLGGIFGGVLRLAPEVLKWFDRKDERKHELNMLNAEMEFSKIKGEIALRQMDAAVDLSRFEAIGKASEGQNEIAGRAGRYVAAVSALVRPFVTYLFVGMYILVKVASFFISLEQNGDWRVVAVTLWGPDDMSILYMIVSFWFVGRAIEKQNAK